MLPHFSSEAEILKHLRPEDVPIMVLTGGPCAGKTTALCRTEQKLLDRGFTVFMPPEVPTLLINAGIKPDANGLDFQTFQRCVFEETLARELNYRRYVARSKAKKKVVICDRGFMDILGYAKADLFKQLAHESGLKIPHLRDLPYNAVFHLVTAAFGAEAFYTVANNTARQETTLGEARERDKETLEAWMGHPHWRSIDNSTGFEEKIDRLFQEVCVVLGIPVPIEIERKYLIDPSFNPRLLKELRIPFECVQIEQMYLTGEAPGNEGRIRRRGQDGTYVYYRTHKWEIPGTFARAETEKHISPEMYGELARVRDPRFAVIQKHRFCFAWENQYFELDVFRDPATGLLLLEVELTRETSKVSLPPFLPVLEDVTGNKMYSNYEIARIRA
ncbi:MAG: AAA family ATPase [Parcubacteria group bacterium]|nr:AAA family ATPase [Parcubacteria group bacterium]